MTNRRITTQQPLIQVLQSSCAKESSCLPKWLLSACGTLMTQRLVAPPPHAGVTNLMKAVLEIGTPNQAKTASVDPKKVEVVASIVSNPTISGHSPPRNLRSAF